MNSLEDSNGSQRVQFLGGVTKLVEGKAKIYQNNEKEEPDDAQNNSLLRLRTPINTARFLSPSIRYASRDLQAPLKRHTSRLLQFFLFGTFLRGCDIGSVAVERREDLCVRV